MTRTVKQVPRSDSFVSPRTLEPTRELADIALRDLSGDLMLIELKDAPTDPRRAWTRVLNLVPDAQWVAPVLVDEAGTRQFPTGELSVRFRRSLSSADLKRFAEEHGLQFERRNEFVPNQAVFAPAHPRETYLPGLVETISQDPDVSATWPITLSGYQRS